MPSSLSDDDMRFFKNFTPKCVGAIRSTPSGKQRNFKCVEKNEEKNKCWKKESKRKFRKKNKCERSGSLKTTFQYISEVSLLLDR